MAYVRPFIVSIVVIRSLQLWKLPVARTTLARSIWIAHWVIAIGVWVVAAAPRYRADFLHILFIGGFSLLILAIATRVTLSHGGHDLAQEQRAAHRRHVRPRGDAGAARLARYIVPLQ
jgi:uncharacterized protein involved in response to NO